MSIKTYKITQSEVLKRGIDWTEELLDVIYSSTWITDPGVTVIGAAYDDNTTSAYFSVPGGAVDDTYKITNKVEAGGETLVRTYQFLVVAEKYR